MNHPQTETSFRKALKICHDLFAKKLHDYGAAWRIMRPSSVTDQLYIKANRIRTLEMTGEAMVDEGILPEFIGIINYSIVGLIQCELGAAESEDLTAEEALKLYERHAEESLQLMLRKNHDYDEAWRLMRVSSYTDLILMKVFRTKQIENLGGRTLASEGVTANYMDMMNYAVFAVIKLAVEKAETEEASA
ncbi:MAG: DUF1599 domain-containing protein [Alloprevotella sp.]|nr:DUF1599 domain-containing protein [Alloprevotella sp.]MDY6297823.1 DUF1599 domain-containing protein [Alloprevotella sp.]